MSTTTTTLEAFKNGIAGCKLPKMFQDAVAYTQRMGIRYIWIDSLCIIQDDSLDWQAESSKMGSYYANSFVTLAATKSTGNQDSLFSTLQPKHRHARLGGRSFGKNVNIYARRALPHCYRGAADDSPLLCSAWVYQERLLAPRVLHFGSNEMIWECRESACCEFWPFKESEEYYSYGYQSPKMVYGNIKFGEPEPGRLQIAWHAMFRTYTSLDITRASDRLPALSGLALQMQQQRNDGYLAGLWRKTTLRDCLWQNDPLRTEKRPTPWRFPTWSWISVDTAVNYDGFIPLDAFAYAEVIEVECRPAGTNPFGEVESGHMLLSSQLLPRKLSYEIGDLRGTAQLFPL